MSEITKALVKFQRSCPSIVKDKTGQEGNRTYKYADLAQIMNSVQPILSDCGLFLSQSFEPNGDTYLITRIMHEGGEIIESKIALPIHGIQPKQVGSAITYYRRYAITALLGIAADDDDGEAAQRSGVTHGKPSTLTQQLKESIAAENGKRKFDTPALMEHVNDPRFHTLTGEDGKTIDLFKKIDNEFYWKRTACKEAVAPLFNDLDAATDLSELRAVPFSAENKIRLEICKVAVKAWFDEFHRRFELREKELAIASKDDTSRFLRA